MKPRQGARARETGGRITREGNTVVVVIDPYNDFISRFGKGWPLIREVANEVGLIDHLRQVLAHARKLKLPVVYAPHTRHRRRADPQVPFLNPSQYLARKTRFFADGRHGGRVRADLAPTPDEFVASEHRVSSAFAGTNLDAHLRSIDATHLVVCGLLTNTCVESTARQAVDLGYHVTVISDGVAAWSHEDHAAALAGSLPHIAHAILSTDVFLASPR
jgi:ureidoacrylate peracid hydrolase